MDDPRMNAVERQIREAQARGDFDNLPGAGKPLKPANSNDPDWWVKGLIEREHLDMTGVLPSAIQLRKEAETYPESLTGVPREETVREILQDFNQRVKQDRLRTYADDVPQIFAPTVDVDDMVQRWGELSRERQRQREALRASTPATPQVHKSRWRRRKSRD